MAWTVALVLPMVLCGCNSSGMMVVSPRGSSDSSEGTQSSNASKDSSSSVPGTLPGSSPSNISATSSPTTGVPGESGQSHTSAKNSMSATVKKIGFFARNVQTAPVTLEKLELPLHLNGTIEPDFNKEVDVTSHLSGRVQKVLVKPGDTVKAGQVLIVVESQDVSELEAELLEAQSKLGTAKAHEQRERIIYQEQVERPKTLIEAQTAFKDAGAKRDLAESEYKRTESLFKEKIVAGKDFYAAKAELAHTQAHYEQANAGLQREQHMFQNKALLKNDLQLAKSESQRAGQHLDTLKQRLEFLGMTKAGVQRTIESGKLSGELSIAATVGGVITHMEVAEGEVVHPDKPMFTITDLSVVQVRADLPETHLSRVKIGTGVQIKVAGYPDKAFSGKISFISERVNPDTHMVAIRVRLENPEKQLKKNMSAEIDLDPTLVKALVCPKKAVFEHKGQPHIFVKNASGNFEDRIVTVGGDTPDVIELCAGAKADDLVAIDSLDRLRAELEK